MRPRCTAEDSLDCCPIDSKFSRKNRASILPWDIPSAYFKHLFIAQLMAIALLAFSVLYGCPAFFGSAVSSVVGVSSKKQMIWIHARRVIAFMKHEQSIRNFTVCQHPGNTVSTFEFISIPDFTVTSGHCGCFPKPTSIGFDYLGPKTISNGAGFV